MERIPVVEMYYWKKHRWNASEVIRLLKLNFGEDVWCGDDLFPMNYDEASGEYKSEFCGAWRGAESSRPVRRSQRQCQKTVTY